MPEEKREQDKDLVFALDIGTRSIIGVVGRAEGDRLRVLAIEKEEHGKRAMLDGQIEDIEQVALVARRVTDRLEEKLGCSLRRVCVAAAGRSLRTERGHYALALPAVTRLDSELVGQLESGAVSDAEGRLAQGRESGLRFYLVGYTVSGYLLDHYPLNLLEGHNGQLLEADVVATFLPSEVVESLYAVMERANLELASLTLEPIAALNAAIPADLRLLNLVLADIGAGTADIAACRDGAVVGYTMATTAGDEITEAVMREFLVDFSTAERMKASLDAPAVPYRDVLGLEQTVPGNQVREALATAARALADEISRNVLEVNSGPPSALFLAGGGSKLGGLRELVAAALGLGERRVALAGNNYERSAFSEEYELNDPEYATPLGIALSAGLGLISDSYRILLNGQPAKLFRSGSLTLLELLMMNGYTSADLLGRTGRNLNLVVDGQRQIFRGEPAVPCDLTRNGEPVTPSTLVYAGDSIVFTPALPGATPRRTVGQVLGADFTGTALVNGQPAPLDRELSSGDHVSTKSRSAPPRPREEGPPTRPEERPEAPVRQSLEVVLNGKTLFLPGKSEGTPYYLMDMLEYSGLDFEHLDREVELLVNGAEEPFTRELGSGDQVVIRYRETC